MRSWLTSKSIFILALFCTMPLWAHAQGGDIRRGGVRPTPTPASPGGKTVYIPRTEKVYVTPTTGALTVIAEAKATITVEVLDRRGAAIKSLKATVPDDGAFTFNDLQQGSYRVSGSLEGYNPDKNRAIQVVRNKAATLKLNLVPITRDVVIDLNAGSGMVRMKGNESSGWMPFDNNRIQLQGVRPGKHELEIRPDDASYLTLTTVIDVSDTSSNFKRELPKRESTSDFSSGSASDWTLPDGWRFGPNLRASSRGVALPREETFRYYKNFQLSTDVKLLNGVAASFVLRASDADNCYLIQLTGPNADEPYRLRGFIVEKGVSRRFGTTISIRQIDDLLKSHKFFHISLMMEDNRIEVQVLDTEFNKLLPLGKLVDLNSTFKIGAIGTAVRDNEQFELGSFLVCASVCQN